VLERSQGGINVLISLLMLNEFKKEEEEEDGNITTLILSPLSNLSSSLVLLPNIRISKNINILLQN
jgi:hypothetical protein